jgi:hypothetical protein
VRFALQSLPSWVVLGGLPAGVAAWRPGALWPVPTAVAICPTVHWRPWRKPAGAAAQAGGVVQGAQAAGVHVGHYCARGTPLAAPFPGALAVRSFGNALLWAQPGGLSEGVVRAPSPGALWPVPTAAALCPSSHWRPSGAAVAGEGGGLGIADWLTAGSALFWTRGGGGVRGFGAWRPVFLNCVACLPGLSGPGSA